jgi:hypothetical protein
MEQKHKTIGLSELLDEVSSDLAELRSKHASDYSLKNITIWWALEKERLAMRHNPASIVSKHAGLLRRLSIGFVAGAVTMLAAIAVIRPLMG